MVSTEERLYCKMFVQSDASRDELIEYLRAVTRGTIDRWTILNSTMEMDVRRNEDARSPRTGPKQDEFLYYRFYIDIEPSPDAKRSEYIHGIGVVLEQLWSRGMKAVAACDFEAELPRSGGIRDLE